MKVSIDHPDETAELNIVRLVRGEESPDTTVDDTPVEQSHIFTARNEIHQLTISENIERYIVALVMATREPHRYPDSPLSKWIDVGSSPRGTIGLDKAARAHAWLQGKTFVDPDDVRAVVHGVIGHRIILSYDALADEVDSHQVIDEILKQVAVA